MRSLLPLTCAILALSGTLAVPVDLDLDICIALDSDCEEHKKNSTTVPRLPTIYDNGLVVVDFDIGRPAQRFPLVFDTSSAVSWVPVDKCECVLSFGDNKTYNPYASTTARDLHKKGSIQYDNGISVQFDYWKDTAAFPNDVWTSQSFIVGAAYSISGVPSDAAYVGYFGYGGDDDYVPSKKRSMLKRDGRGGGGSGDQIRGIGASKPPGDRKRWSPKTGYLTFGIDPSLYQGEIAWLPLPSSADECGGGSIYWRTALKGYSVGNNCDESLGTNTFAKFATGEPLIYAPPAQADALHASIGAEYSVPRGRYVLKCSACQTIPDLTLRFEGYDVSLPPSVWTTPVDNDNDLCETIVTKSQDSEQQTWVIGAAFLNNFYHIYDNGENRIGLAYLADQGIGAKITKNDSN